jgi:hypothetical protein
MVLKAQQGEREMYFYGLEDLASAGGDTYGLIGFFLHYSSQVYQELRASNQMDSDCCLCPKAPECPILTERGWLGWSC